MHSQKELAMNTTYFFIQAVLIIGFGVSPVQAVDWKDKKQYPARVEAIVFGDEIVDKSHCLKGTQWNICFGSKDPVAELVCGDPMPGQNCPQVTISNLACHSDALGDSDCAYNFTHSSTEGRDTCLLIGIKARPVTIACPTDLRLQ